jgi:hypothetical protein
MAKVLRNPKEMLLHNLCYDFFSHHYLANVVDARIDLFTHPLQEHETRKHIRTANTFIMTSLHTWHKTVFPLLLN